MADEILTESLLTTADRSAYLYSKIKPIFTDLFVAVIILLIGLIIGKLLGRLVQKVLSSLEINKLIKKGTGINIRLEELFGRAVSYCIFFVSFIMALDIIGLTEFITYIVSVVIIIVIILSFMVELKEFIPNLFAGIYLHRKKAISEGKTIEVDGITGKIAETTLTETKIETKKGDVIYIPNSLLRRKGFRIRKN